MPKPILGRLATVHAQGITKPNRKPRPIEPHSPLMASQIPPTIPEKKLKMIRILTINEIMVEPTAMVALDTDLNILFFSHLF
jgi:hypothetical protein